MDVSCGICNTLLADCSENTLGAGNFIVVYKYLSVPRVAFVVQIVHIPRICFTDYSIVFRHHCIHKGECPYSLEGML
jgi:hypothetical protein